MGLRPNEISALIKEQIKHYDDIIEQKEISAIIIVHIMLYDVIIE